jgi:hypothetical protein
LNVILQIAQVPVVQCYFHIEDKFFQLWPKQSSVANGLTESVLEQSDEALKLTAPPLDLG